MTKLCRWGILGAAGIARKNWHSIRNAGNATLVAVASRQCERAEQFIHECQAQVPFETRPRASSYDELLKDSEIDAIYIPLPTGIRKEWVIKAANAGKHVLCEKPCGVTAADVSEMLAVCKKNNVQFMDGIMFLHSSRLPSLRETLDDGASVGDLRRITTQFSFRGEEEFLAQNIRVSGELEPLGCLGDLGWYNIRFTLWVMKHQMPERVAGRLLTSTPSDKSRSVPLEFSGEMFFGNGVSASFYCSFITEMQQWADVCGTRGRIHVRDFVLPYYGSELSYEVWNDRFVIKDCQFNMEPHRRRVAVSEYSNNAPTAQESKLFHNFSQLVLSGQVDPSWGENVLKTQRVLDACLESAQNGGREVVLAEK